MKLIFGMQISMKVAYKLISFDFLGTKNWLQDDTMIVEKDDEVFSNYSKQLLCKSLQYFKKLEMEFIFCMQINTKVSKNWHYRFLWKQQIRRLVIFVQYIKK